MILKARSAQLLAKVLAILLVVALREVCGGDLTRSLAVAKDSFFSGISREPLSVHTHAHTHADNAS